MNSINRKDALETILGNSNFETILAFDFDDKDEDDTALPRQDETPINFFKSIFYRCLFILQNP